MKQLKAGAVLCGILLVMGCALPLGEDFMSLTEGRSSLPDTGNTPDTPDTGTGIVDYNLQNYVPVPIAGVAPVISLSTRSDMEVRVNWSVKTDSNPDTFTSFTGTSFEEGKVYQAKITLTAKNGWAFDGGYNFMYPLGSVAIQPEANTDLLDRELTPVTYLPAEDPKNVTEIDLTRYVPAPVRGNLPERIIPGVQYTGTISWKVTGGLPLVTVFQGNTNYTAVVTLNAAPGYLFQGGIMFYHEEDTEEANDSPPGNLNFTDLDGFALSAARSAGKVTVDFPLTQVSSSAAVTSFSSMDPSTTTALTVMADNKDKYTVDLLEITLPGAAGAVAAIENLTSAAMNTILTRGDAGNSPPRVSINGGGGSSFSRVLKPYDGLGSEDKPLITVGGGVTLTLADIVLDGGVVSRSAPLVIIEAGGTLILDSGAVLRNNKIAQDNSAAGVLIKAGGTLIMEGSTAQIMNNTNTVNASAESDRINSGGGGVYIEAGGEFILKDGAITGNQIVGEDYAIYPPREGETYAGAVYIAPGGSFTMNGGSIMKNNDSVIKGGQGWPMAFRAAGGVYVGGDFASGLRGSFTMNGGKINTNEALYFAGGVFVGGGRFVMQGRGCLIQANDSTTWVGGIVVLAGECRLYQGKVEGNKTTGANLRDGTIQDLVVFTTFPAGWPTPVPVYSQGSAYVEFMDTNMEYKKAAQ